MIFDIIIRLCLCAAALGGLYISLRWGLPQFRSLFPDSCQPIAKSSFSSLFGIPFWSAGVAVYILALIAGITTYSWLVLIAFFASILALLASFYLAIIMVSKLRATCFLCWLAHLLNVSIFVIWVVIALHAS